MRNRVFEVIQHTDVMADIGTHQLVLLLVLDVTEQHPGPFIKECAPHNCLHDILDSRVDGRHPLREPTEGNRVYPFKTADLEYVLVGEIEAIVEEADPAIRNLFRSVPLTSPSSTTERAAMRIHCEALPRE
jgi:hypothetical protein